MLKEFLKESPLAKEVGVEVNVVVHRRTLKGEALKEIERSGLSLDISEEKDCELEVNGRVVAYGKIVKKRGRSFFKVSQLKGVEKK